MALSKSQLPRCNWCPSAAAAVSARAQLPPRAILSRRSSVAKRAADSVDTQPSNSTGGQDAAPLQVTRSNFAAALPAVKAALQDCQFFSFDCEMTGLFLQGQEDYVVDDVADRYAKTAAAAEQFLVLQFGLSAFMWTVGSYEVRSFNFHLFPMPYEDVDVRFMSQASSLAFLASQGFDFNKVWQQDGFKPDVVCRQGCYVKFRVGGSGHTAGCNLGFKHNRAV